ncbi:MAG: GlsB/YeaQ/YmgE family stress response membrane protein [Planctomycetia bacterium]|nr:GlsB/YeaQ/YmgE family stress response membrane protein [Planctomycetia bacterium]
MPDFSQMSGLSWDVKGQILLNIILLWTGMAVVVGGTAKLLVPGVRPRGTCATLVLGVLSSTIGCFLMRQFFLIFFGDARFNPISLPGIIASILTATFFLGIYHLIVQSIDVGKKP